MEVPQDADVDVLQNQLPVEEMSLKPTTAFRTGLVTLCGCGPACVIVQARSHVTKVMVRSDEGIRFMATEDVVPDAVAERVAEWVALFSATMVVAVPGISLPRIL